ncbi:MAG: helix-turn-helix domain-containing protein [Clostridia bacterium]|nr:helix-turn-helix domain-containing protein [Clostridia bacterium]
MQGYFNLSRETQNQIAYGRVHDPNVDVHFHSQIELYIILSGKIEVLINDKRRLLQKGDISVSLSYDAHGYRSVESSEALYLIVPTDLLSDFSHIIADKQLGEPFTDDPETYKKVLDAMENILRSQNDLTLRGYIYIIFGAILDLATLEDRQNVRETRFGADILIYISRNFREDLTLSSLAERFGYNPSYLSRYFREAFGISFSQYLSTLRLREAVLLLRSGEHSVTECALDSGFGSTRSFYRAFYEEFKCTPKEYLKDERTGK